MPSWGAACQFALTSQAVFECGFHSLSAACSELGVVAAAARIARHFTAPHTEQGAAAVAAAQRVNPEQCADLVEPALSANDGCAVLCCAVLCAAAILEDPEGHCWVALHYFWRWVSCS